MRQTRIMSLIEATANVVVGYGLAIATQIVVFPWFGLQADLPTHLAIGLLFLIVSLLRSYLLRRLFERHRALR
jgi:membrane protein implicated in regulation of membrane protease activity